MNRQVETVVCGWKFFLCVCLILAVAGCSDSIVEFTGGDNADEEDGDGSDTPSSDGDGSENPPLDGDVPDGDIPDGDIPDPDGDIPDPDGDIYDGDIPDPDGDIYDGDIPDPDGDGGGEGEECVSDEDCEPGLYCHPNMAVCLPCACDTYLDCMYSSEQDYDCVGCFCLPMFCDTNYDCRPGSCCVGGQCMACPIPSCDELRISINETSCLVRPGMSSLLTLTATDFNGTVVDLDAAECMVVWSSDNPEIADVRNGTVTGGAAEGMATISVHLGGSGDSIQCTNLPYLPETTVRVIVLDSRGDLIDGARVLLNDREGNSEGGVVEFRGIDCTRDACEVHIFKSGYEYLSVFGLRTNDIILPLDRYRNPMKISGVKGNQDVSGIPAYMVEDVRLGFSGISLDKPIIDTDLRDSLGEMRRDYIRLGSVIDDSVAIPSGFEAYLNDDEILDTFYATGRPGPAALWGIGGYAELSSLIEIVTQVTGDEIRPHLIIFALIPFLENFYHGVLTDLQLPDLDRIVDSEDINYNGDYSDMAPDYDNYLDVGNELRLRQPISQQAGLMFSELPAAADGVCMNSLFISVTATIPGAGRVPLGIGAAPDSDNSYTPGDCIVGEGGLVNVPFAPKYFGWSGSGYGVTAMAIPSEGFLGEIDAESFRYYDKSVVTTRLFSPPYQKPMPEFLPVVGDSTWNLLSKRLSSQPVPGASFNRAVFRVQKPEIGIGNVDSVLWKVYWAQNMTSIELPASMPRDAAAGLERLSVVEVQAVAIQGSDFQELFTFNGENLMDLDEIMYAYCSHPIQP